jgi:type I restriction enzyme S subunit
MTVPSNYSFVTLSEVLTPASRPESIKFDQNYSILGAHWYAKGLYTKDIKTGSQIRAKTVYRVEQGDFVYNRLFAWKGSFAIANSKNHNCYVSNEFPCFQINLDEVEPTYLWKYFSRSVAWNEALGLSSGGTPTSRNRLKEEKLLAMRIPLPPLEEQRRIVARIEELAAKVEEAQGLREKSCQQVDAFVTNLHLDLAGSRVCVLDEILELDEDRQEIVFGEEYPQVGVKGFGGGLFVRETLDSTQTTYKAFNRLYEGAIVLSQVKGWEGAIAGCPSRLAGRFVSPEYRTFRCISGQAIPEYMSYLVVTPWFWTQLKNLTRGMGGRRERTRPEKFLKLKIPMPTVEQQEQALKAFSKVTELKKLQAKTAPELDALLPSILDKAFKGNL